MKPETIINIIVPFSINKHICSPSSSRPWTGAGSDPVGQDLSGS